MSTVPSTPQPWADNDRKAALAEAVAREVAAGARVESQSDYQAVVVRGQRVNHTLHLILTLVTCSLWGIVWLILVLTGGEKRVVLQVDPYGNLLRS